MEPFKVNGTNPGRFWMFKAPPMSVLRVPAARVCSLDVVSSVAERVHVITKSNRTKKRNRLDYELNQALTFAKLELMHEGHKAKKDFEWESLVKFHTNFMVVSDEEEKWAEILDARWLKEASDAAAAEKEESMQVPIADGTLQAEVVLEPVEEKRLDLLVGAVSARGRQRRMRVFGDDFVRLDDDWGLL